MRTVLIADRSLTIRRVVEHALGGRAARVVGAADADELYRLARVEHPDVVLCDASLPGLALEELRESFARVPELVETPFVLLSSALDPLQPDDARALGASGLILKPFDMSSLAESIERALERGVVPPPRPAMPAEEDADTAEENFESSREPGSIPEPPSFDSVWEEGAGAKEPLAEELLEDPQEEIEEFFVEESEPLSLPDEGPAYGDEEEEPLGPLSPESTAFDPLAERVPLPGDEDFRLGLGDLASADEPDEHAPVEPAPREDVAPPSLDDMERLEPELRVLIERIVREVAWEVVPDIVERVVRERSSGVLPDSSSGDRKP